jgi:HSP20 family molecular chaperone IbpA
MEEYYCLSNLGNNFRQEENLRIFVPNIETFVSEDGVRILMDMPGLNPDSVEIETDNSSVTIRGALVLPRAGKPLSDLSPCTREFCESFFFEEDLDHERIEAEFFHDTLQVIIPCKGTITELEPPILH